MDTQLTRGLKRRVMYVENKDGMIEGARARIGWVTFSKSAQTVYYRGRELTKLKGQGVRGNFMDIATREEFWVSGVKKRGSNAHPAERGISIIIDDDARLEYEAIRSSVQCE
ncbi:hypothetical protein PY365_15000 [Roseiarcaceae bacterium H3SJ34-1]|uniref:hypothetical protein n=1 Tax=Terripilifer ovatus TaxID=3032367 RepID=UPI003AB97CB9|nr:hypothetical protein [Roseiarcaceae bacterium H3SJ34-1]